MLTDKYLVKERPHSLGGTQRLYECPNGVCLSLVNAKRLHSYPFAWEAAVLYSVDGLLRYDTELTDDVVVFDTDDEANAFIEHAATITLPNEA